ncbi:MAG TPA: hypothetical protein VIF62_33855 [Labilithrix sp.]|jgi:hypothetical protein
MKPLRWIVPCLVLAVACASAPDKDERVETLKPPFEQKSFEHFNSYVGHQCGTIDCHGSRYRNMRIYGALGLRLAGNDCTLATVPGVANAPCTPGDVNADPSVEKRELLPQSKDSERLASYLSITGLEPEILDAVVRDHGANPERLTFMRKAYGDENHKGFNLVERGSPGEKCLLSFFAGAIDTDSCDAPLNATDHSAVLACPAPSSDCAASLR